jgi:hypothetical protein
LIQRKEWVPASAYPANRMERTPSACPLLLGAPVSGNVNGAPRPFGESNPVAPRFVHCRVEPGALPRFFACERLFLTVPKRRGH